MKTTRIHDSGRLKPMADQRPSRRRIEQQTDYEQDRHLVGQNPKDVVSDNDERA